MMFLHNGSLKISDIPEKTEKIGILNNHLLKCEIQEELNGIFKLELEIENKSKYLKDLKQENMISVKVPGLSQRQFFRIKIVDENDYTTEVVAYHIFYDLAENLIEDIYIVGGNGQMALTKILRETQYPHSFTGQSTVTKTNNIRIVRYNPVQAILGSEDNTFVNRLGGEITRDNYNIKMNTRRGIDRNISIEYGKNLLGYKATVDYSTVYTRIMPKGADELLLPEKYVDSPLINKYPQPKIGQVELNDIKAYDEQRENEDEVSKEEAYELMRNHVNQMYSVEHVDLPRVNYDVDFVELSSTEEYKNYKVLERIYLGDSITVKHQKNGLNIQARVISYTYDCLSKSYTNMELGNFQKSFLDIKNQLDKLRTEMQESDLSILEMAKKRATDLIHSGFGGYVRVFPDRILIMDTDDPNTAQNVWQWNKNGLGFSSTGINGEYGLAMTIDGHIVADFITAGTLSGDLIKGGLIQGQYLEINNQTKYAPGYNPSTKAEYDDLKTLEQEFHVRDGELASQISGVDANNNKKISRLIQTINGLTLMMTGTEETVVTQSPSGDVVVDETKLKSKVPGMIDDLIDKHGKVITRDWTNYKWATAEQDKEEFTAIYNHLYSSPDLMGTAKNNLYNAYRGYTIEHKVLSDYYTNIQNGTLEYNKTQEDYRLREYRMAIKFLVQRIEEAKKYIEEYKNSKIVTQYKAEITATKKEFNSEYTKITTQISGVDGKVNKLSTDVSNINQKADSITLRVGKTEGDIRSVNTQISTIKQKADSIELSVGKKVDANKIISSINLSNESVRISASKIHLDGYVTVNKLTTEKYVRAHQLNTTSSDRVGVGVTNVNAGRLSSNTAHTSGSTNRLELENQWINFYNGGLNKMMIGFSSGYTAIPFIRLGAGSGYGGNGLIQKDPDWLFVGYRNPDGSGYRVLTRYKALDLYMKAPFINLASGSEVNFFSDLDKPLKLDRQDPAGRIYLNTYRFAFPNNAGIYLDDNGRFDFCRSGTIIHSFYSNGTKSGGTIEVDGKNLGMSPVDSPQVLLEDLYIDEEVTEEGTKIYLNDTFKKTIAFPYAVFCSNNAKCVEKNIHYFVVKGNGKTDIKVVGKRIAHEDVYYKEMESVPIPEVELREREVNGKVELNSREELDALRTAEKHNEVVSDEY